LSAHRRLRTRRPPEDQPQSHYHPVGVAEPLLPWRCRWRLGRSSREARNARVSGHRGRDARDRRRSAVANSSLATVARVATDHSLPTTRTIDKGHSFAPSRLLLEDFRQCSVNLAVDGHSGVTRFDRDLAGAGIEAGPPRNDPVAMRVDSD
jgi:hypothetical protein